MVEWITGLAITLSATIILEALANAISYYIVLFSLGKQRNGFLRGMISRQRLWFGTPPQFMNIRYLKKANFDKRFDGMFSYEKAKALENTPLLNMLDNYRRISYFSWAIVTVIFLGVITIFALIALFGFSSIIANYILS